MAGKTRLPTLGEVLHRQSAPPVDLFSFYLYMRDQQRSVDYLDFFLDCEQHLALCRLYVRELRRSVLNATPDVPENNEKSHYSEAPRSSDDFAYEKQGDRAISPFLRSHPMQGGASVESSPTFTQERVPVNAAYDKAENRQSWRSSLSREGGQGLAPSPEHTVNRADIRASAERILYTYLVRGAEREIALPSHIHHGVSNAIEVDGRDDPEVFDDAKEYVFQAMERDAFPGFLRAKALGNLVPPSALFRLILGLMAMFGAFWTAFSLIFLNYSKSTRVWILLPFFIGVYALMSHQYNLDPLLALSGLSESTFMSFMRIREPYGKQTRDRYRRCFKANLVSQFDHYLANVQSGC
ncbi:Bud site selection protein, Revert to axial protein 1 [Saitoella coloradoensis]